MKLYQMVIKDVVRRKRRLLYATIGVAIGTMTVIGILTVSMAAQTRIYDQLEKYGPNLSITPAINNIDMTLGDLSLGTISVGDNYIDESKLPQIREITDNAIKDALGIQTEDALATIAPQLFVNTKIKDISVIVVGIDPEQEQEIKTWWQIDQGLYIASPEQAVIGSEVADLLGLNVGDSIPLNNSTVTVSGILEGTGANDDYQIFASLATVQQAFDKKGWVSTIDIRALCNACPVEHIAHYINKDISGVRAVAITQVASTEMGMLDRINNFMLALAGITLAIALFAVVNTILASVHERIKDIGIMRAVGASRNQIIRVFIYEAIIIGIVGGVIGYFAGNALALVIGPIIFEGTSIGFVPIYLSIAIALATFIAVVATIYPAFRATRIRVADSFRSV
jgi:putative ABC transport system permease protein